MHEGQVAAEEGAKGGQDQILSKLDRYVLNVRYLYNLFFDIQYEYFSKQFEKVSWYVLSVFFAGPNHPRDCGDLYISGNYFPGVKWLDIKGDGNLIQVYCDEDGWTVFQSRGQFGNQEDYFYRDMEEYTKGFGVPGDE